VVGFTIVSPHYKAIYDNAYMKTYALLEEANMPLVFHGAYAWGGDQSLSLCNKFYLVHALASPGSTFFIAPIGSATACPSASPSSKSVGLRAALPGCRS